MEGLGWAGLSSLWCRRPAARARGGVLLLREMHWFWAVRVQNGRERMHWYWAETDGRAGFQFSPLYVPFSKVTTYEKQSSMCLTSARAVFSPFLKQKSGLFSLLSPSVDIAASCLAVSIFYHALHVVWI
jgi:hypothetical protein